MVTHGNLLHNERMIGAAFGMDEESVVVGWLPLYHDMGLIGNVLQPLYAGGAVRADVAGRLPAAAAALAGGDQPLPGDDERRPELRLRAVRAQGEPGGAARGSISSSWRVAFNGAEPVRAATLERFAEAFAPCGFRPRGLLPLLRPGRGDAVRHRRPSRAVAAGGRRRAGELRPGLAGAAAGGRPIRRPGRERRGRARRGRSGSPGPSVAARLLGATRRPRRATSTPSSPDGEGPFLRTGDLGFLAGGELYVTGRLKDLIILRGRNLYPQDVELTAEREPSRPAPGRRRGLRGGGRDGEERLVVVHEVARHPRDGSRRSPRRCAGRWPRSTRRRSTRWC